jgi:hypothetical protein
MSQYEADTNALRASFATYGEIKDYFDLVQKRGMIFITYVRRTPGSHKLHSF